MSQKVTIAVDAMGGDHAPDVVLEGVAAALAADADILGGAVRPEGRRRAVCRVARALPRAGDHAGHRHGRAPRPSRSQEEGLVAGGGLPPGEEGAAQGFFSAGSTGACLAAGTLVMGRIKGVSRPCLATVVPSPVRPIIMCDVGANADCKPDYLVQFAQMGSVYAQKIFGYEKPSVALLNIGEEDTKGSQFAQDAHQLLRRRVPNFVGNCEGRDVLAATYDVVVTDGFTGNVCLKTIEGAAKVLFGAVKDAMMSSTKAKIGALCVKDSLRGLKDVASPDTYGGAPLLGVHGACIVGHGSSNATAIKNGVLTTARVVRQGVSEIIEHMVAKGNDSDTITH